jgi:hypothetical protein
MAASCNQCEVIVGIDATLPTVIKDALLKVCEEKVVKRTKYYVDDNIGLQSIIWMKKDNLTVKSFSL